MKEDILQEVISGYRKVIEARYDYQIIAQKYTLPEVFNEERISEIKNYLLEYLYPAPEKRAELNAAFAHLDDYTKDPSKLLRLLLDSASLIFKYGRHLPKILNTGLKALRSFNTVNEFEANLAEKAIEEAIELPLDKEEMYTLISLLPRQEIEDFIESSQSLFETLHDRVLVKKVLEIVKYLIKKMEKRPEVYSEEEIKGLQIGFDIIHHGDMIFSQFKPKDQTGIIELVIQIERDALRDIY